MSLGVDDGVHLPVAEACAVGLFRAVMYACAARDVGGLGHGTHPRPPVVFETVREMACEPSRRVGVHVVVDGLLADGRPLLAQHAGRLSGRPPLVHYHTLHTPPQQGVLAATPR